MYYDIATELISKAGDIVSRKRDGEKMTWEYATKEVNRYACIAQRHGAKVTDVSDVTGRLTYRITWPPEDRGYVNDDKTFIGIVPYNGLTYADESPHL